MPTAVAVAIVDDQGLAAAREPWDGIVRERADGTDRWAGETGPITGWTRTLEVEPLGGGLHRVTQRTDYELDLPFFTWLFAYPARRELRRVPLRDKPPWWAPTEALDSMAARAVCALCILSMASGYLGTLLTQTITFAGGEFGVGAGGQGVALAVSRVDLVLAFSAVALADRLGRRRVLAIAVLVAIGFTAAGALTPSLPLLIASQVPARGLTAAMNLVIGVHAAEEVPSHARAWTASVLALINALGAGVCVATLPAADLGLRGWRLSYVVPLAFLPLVLMAVRRLPESRRFMRSRAGADAAAPRLRGHGKRLGMLCGGGYLAAAFVNPAAQLQNTFLRDERGFSALRITVFTLLTGTPAGIGVVAGGRLAERSRRSVAAVGLVAGTILVVLAYMSAGWPLWALGIAAGIFSAATVPALAVYGPELFPTAVRGRANGFISVAARIGAVTGLLTAGLLSTRLGGLGPALAVLAVGPLLLALLVITVYPETASRELEDLNPEDREPPP
ncbi:MAG: MFS transporter [Acidimicrobiales bacterium]